MKNEAAHHFAHNPKIYRKAEGDSIISGFDPTPNMIKMIKNRPLGQYFWKHNNELIPE